MFVLRKSILPCVCDFALLAPVESKVVSLYSFPIHPVDLSSVSDEVGIFHPVELGHSKKIYITCYLPTTVRVMTSKQFCDVNQVL